VKGFFQGERGNCKGFPFYYFLEVIRSSEFKETVTALGGYDLKD
jgi:hypothetical protein